MAEYTHSTKAHTSRVISCQASFSLLKMAFIFAVIDSIACVEFPEHNRYIPRLWRSRAETAQGTICFSDRYLCFSTI